MSQMTQNDKTKNSRFYGLKILGYKKLQKFKVLKIYLTDQNFIKCFLKTVVWVSGGTS